MLNEFKQFISRGNVIDLAVGIIIGAAFTGIVNSLVNDILMPPIGWIMGGLDFSNYFIDLTGGDYESLAEARAAGAATLNYGLFINAVIKFFVVAFAVFILIKKVNHFRRAKADEKPATPAPPPRQELLLAEIRDLLRDRPVGGGTGQA